MPGRYRWIRILITTSAMKASSSSAGWLGVYAASTRPRPTRRSSLSDAEAPARQGRDGCFSFGWPCRFRRQGRGARPSTTLVSKTTRKAQAAAAFTASLTSLRSFSNSGDLRSSLGTKTCVRQHLGRPRDATVTSWRHRAYNLSCHSYQPSNASAVTCPAKMLEKRLRKPAPAGGHHLRSGPRHWSTA